MLTGKRITQQTARRLMLSVAAVAIVSVALWQGSVNRYRPILERSTQVKLDPAVDLPSVVWIDNHTAVAKCGDDLPCVVDASANRVRLLPRVSMAPLWDDVTTAKRSLYNRGEISPDKKTVLWKVSSGVVRILLDGSASRQVVTYPKAWLDRNKRPRRTGVYSGTAGYPGSALPPASSPGTPVAHVPDPYWVESILWSGDSRHWLSVEASGKGPYLLRLRDFDGHIVNHVQLPGMSDDQYWKLLGKLPANRALLRSGEKSFVTVQIDRALAALEVFSVTPPPDCYVAIPSPDGPRLLWEGIADAEPDPRSWVDTLRARLGQYQSRSFTMVLDVSDLDGENVRELCREKPGVNGPYVVQWTPDSKHITFVMNKKLWMLPVP